ncbi:uncharacterized protein LOC143616167 [Bidens hawaiensis]|uniref:uncharacterized protein LOC143616167 n=1 Tax=Bidens hawaiensis TaxID=980011 RepID=UPI0040490DC2
MTGLLTFCPSFVSIEFEPLLGIESSKLDTKYSIELANGKLIETGEVVRNCNLLLENHQFDINLLPIDFGSFDVVVGMDWLSKNQAEIICLEKQIRLPLPSGETLFVQGERGNSDSNLTSIMQTRKMLRKGYPTYLVKVIDTKAEEPKIEDIPVVREFPEDLPGLPPPRQVEFRINLVQDAAPVARSPYRLAPSEMQEMVKRANVVAVALSKKEREKPLRVRALGLTIQTSLTTLIRDAQREALKTRNLKYEKLRGLEAEFIEKSDGALYLIDRVWVPLFGNLRRIVLDEAHKSRYSINPGSTKMYKDLQEHYWWPNLKGDIAVYVSKYLTCSKVKAEHRKPPGLLKEPKIPQWKWDNITIDFITKLPVTPRNHDAIWVSPWKGIIRFGKRGKLSPRFVGPFKIIQRIGPVAYRLELPSEFRGIHNVFHVSNIKKCLSDESLIVPVEDIRIDDKLRFVEEPVEVMDWKIQKLRHNKIKLVKVRRNSRLGPEFTWERQDKMKRKYPQLFPVGSETSTSS